MFTSSSALIPDALSKEANKKPRKALSAYNYFFRSERARILGVDIETLEKQLNMPRKHRKTPGMIGFKGMAVFVGQRWKTLSSVDKAPFERLAIKDKDRYKREMEVWERESTSMSFMNHHSGRFELFTFPEKTIQSPKRSHTHNEDSSLTELKFILEAGSSKRTRIADQNIKATEFDATLSNFTYSAEALPGLSHYKIEVNDLEPISIKEMLNSDPIRSVIETRKLLEQSNFLNRLEIS